MGVDQNHGPNMLPGVVPRVGVTVKSPSVYVVRSVPFGPGKLEKVMVVADAAEEASVPPTRIIAPSVALSVMSASLNNYAASP